MSTAYQVPIKFCMTIHVSQRMIPKYFVILLTLLLSTTSRAIFSLINILMAIHGNVSSKIAWFSMSVAIVVCCGCSGPHEDFFFFFSSFPLLKIRNIEISQGCRYPVTYVVLPVSKFNLTCLDHKNVLFSGFTAQVHAPCLSNTFSSLGWYIYQHFSPPQLKMNYNNENKL